MFYELWHLEGRNLLEDFESLNEVLEAVRDYLDTDPIDYSRNLALARVDDEGHTTWLGTGTEILKVLEEQIPSESRRSA